MNGARNAAIGARFGRAAARWRMPRPSAPPRSRPGTSPGWTCRRARILEIGCGTGLLTRELARRLGPADWTLTDISPAMLEIARLGPAPQGSVRYAALDGEHPDALPGGYDLICSSLAVQWFGDLNAGLGRLAALLAPGGHLAIATLAETPSPNGVPPTPAPAWTPAPRPIPRPAPSVRPWAIWPVPCAPNGWYNSIVTACISCKT